VLLIQYLDGNRELVKLTADATVGAGNGLSHPLVVDLNGDDTADLVYAGDIQGNLWKFDLTSSIPSNWNVAFNGNPLFVARGYPAASAPGSNGERQPITTAPSWTFNPNGGINLVFGTGRDVTAADAASTSVQTIYSVWDNTLINLSTNPITFTGGTRVPDSTSGGRTSLLERTQTASTTTTKGRFMTTSTATEVVYTGVNAKRGWFFNLPEPGERVIANPKVLDKRLIAIPSIQPTLGSQTQSSEESCEPSATPATNYITVLDAVTGKPYAKRPFFDTNGDGLYTHASAIGGDVTNASRVSTGKDPMLFIPTKSTNAFETSFLLVSSRPGGGAGTEPNKAAAVLDDPARVNWRQLQ
jgi:type IV pilus assembly protein PilY1